MGLVRSEPPTSSRRLRRAFAAVASVGVVLVACSQAPSGAVAGAPCTADGECASGQCNQAKSSCLASTCADGRKNGDESAVDCGRTCDGCADGKACRDGADCASLVCGGGVCQPPSSSDGVKNGTETDVDCGGSGNPPCAEGKACALRSDCTTLVCTGGTCETPTPADGEKNGTETDVDCGGPSAPPCADGKTCTLGDDCASVVCTGAVCQAPTPNDHVKNGSETDVDCGGAGNPTCATGASCLVDADCTSAGCNYAKKCSLRRSCTRHFGGDTCGLGGAGGSGAAAWEECCVTAPITPTSGPTKDVPIALGKYQVTAGRMRAFLEAVGYDVRGFVQSARAAGKIPSLPGDAQNRSVLEPSWDLYLPTSFAGNTNAGEIADCTQGQWTGSACNPGSEQPGLYTSVRNHLGGVIFKSNAQSLTGCLVGAPGTHAFRFPAGQQDGPEPDFDQDEYDTKAMQCIDYLMGQAFCVWDGGRLELLDEWLAALGPGTYPWSPSVAQTGPVPVQPGTNTYWGCRFPWRTDQDQSQCASPFDASTKSIEYADYNYSYEYPKQINVDYIVFISAPGRTRGRGPQGHADLVANNFELTTSLTFSAAYAGAPTPFNATHKWTGNGSWEGHQYTKGAGSTTMLLNKYGKLGLRCAYP